MRKSTQKTLMALSIILIFALSSIAFVFSGFQSGTNTNTDLKPLESFVVNGEINQNLENAYLQNGFTFLKFYYDESADSNIVNMIDSVPESFTTPSGQQQVIVIKIKSQETYAKILNINGENDVFNITTDKIFDALCSSLIVMPTECTISALNLTG
ncbi:MAG TPA: hypothetical protein HA230_00460 [Candidatus Aenigmarchaeota archaeon]|nr:hypothetical protein [Candidatus Aenigmarchaeota archaeon]